MEYQNSGPSGTLSLYVYSVSRTPILDLNFLKKGAAYTRNFTVFIDTKNAKNTRLLQKSFTFHFPKGNSELDPLASLNEY